MDHPEPIRPRTIQPLVMSGKIQRLTLILRDMTRARDRLHVEPRRNLPVVFGLFVEGNDLKAWFVADGVVTTNN